MTNDPQKELQLTEKQQALLEFVKEQHGEQKRKYTKEPYWTHPLSVAAIIDKHGSPMLKKYNGIEIALCHDLFEDTKCKFETLSKKLQEIGYSGPNALQISFSVLQLTDVYVPEKYPKLNRKQRKGFESKRLSGISPVAQTVKYADLIDNTGSIVQFDPGFAKTYLAEKMEILDGMRSGEIRIFVLCCHTFQNAINLLTTTNHEPTNSH